MSLSELEDLQSITQNSEDAQSQTDSALDSMDIAMEDTLPLHTENVSQGIQHNQQMSPQMVQPTTQQHTTTSGSLVDVRPMQYPSFDNNQSTTQTSTRGIEMVSDIPLAVSVELGKAKKNISEILDFGVGSVVVLDKVAGDPVEIIVNGKLIARGEVVVINENYGVRITELL